MGDVSFCVPVAHPSFFDLREELGDTVWLPVPFWFSDPPLLLLPCLPQQHTFWHLQARYMMMTYIFIFFMSIKHTSSCKHLCFFFLSPIDVWVPLMVIYCRVEQPGLNCTLKLLTILMLPNHPKMYLFPTRRVRGSPLLTVFCGRIQSLERTCRQTSSAGFQGRLVPSF